MSLSVENKVVPIGAIQPHPDNYGEYHSVVVCERPGGHFVQVAGHGVVEATQLR